MASKKQYLKEAYVVALTDLILIDKRIQALSFAVSGCRTNAYDQKLPSAVASSSDAIRGELYRARSYAMERILMFGSIQGGEAQKVANRLAFEHLAKGNYGLTHFLSPGGRYFGGYRAGEREEFIAEIRAALDCSEQRCSEEHGHSQQCSAPERQKEVQQLREALDQAEEREQRLKEVIGAFAEPVLERVEDLGER